MRTTTLIPWALTILMWVTIAGCSQKAENPQQAADMLTAAKTWKIDQIRVNGTVTFKDGKMQQQFGGIDFQRYMETVEIGENGSFTGVFKGETKPFALEWKSDDRQITVGLPGAAPSASDWTISPADVQKEEFTMKTRSTAYDYPNVTTIELVFKAAN